MTTLQSLIRDLIIACLGANFVLLGLGAMFGDQSMVLIAGLSLAACGIGLTLREANEGDSIRDGEASDSKSKTQED
jgi:hypothetical protein